MPVKICIDARPLQNAHKTRGVGVLLRNLLPQMSLAAPNDEVSLITLKGKSLTPLFPHEQRLETWRLERPNRFNWIADQLFLRTLVAKSGVDLFFATDFNSYLVPRNGLKVVSMAYDLIPFIFAETMDSQPLPVRVGWRTNFPKLKKSTAVITISQATKDDLVRLLGIEAERVHVIYPGINHDLFNMVNAEDSEKCREILARHGITGRFFLYVGDSEWRKNLRRVLEALTGIGDDLKIVLAGKRAMTDTTLHGWVEDLGLQGRVIFPGFIPDADLPLLYGSADAFVFPSLYEGFGFPIAEAMACGCPVISSDVSSMPEVAGEAALLVNPLSVTEIRAAMVRVLTDIDVRNKMIEAGLQQAAKFSWRRCAEETVSVLRAVVGEL
jgi:glycosyltransferase involved in cell wall biosynthesis